MLAQNQGFFVYSQQIQVEFWGMHHEITALKKIYIAEIPGVNRDFSLTFPFEVLQAKLPFNSRFLTGNFL